MVAPEALRALQGIDWDFAVPRTGYVAPPHWYPGTFIPAVSDTLIEALTPTGGQVFDPYGGIGTTGWSAARMGRSAIVTDINPVALLTAYVTTALLAMRRIEPASITIALGALARLIGRNDDLFGAEPPMPDDTRLDELAKAVCSTDPSMMFDSLVAGNPNTEGLLPWFEEESLRALERAAEKINSSRSDFVKLLGFCMISAVARSVSSQHASWGHIADNVRPKELTNQNLNVAMLRWLKKMSKFLSVDFSGNGKVTVTVERRNWSVAGEVGNKSADLLLTSPPYADAIDYILAQRLSLYIMGYDDKALQQLVGFEIGARRKRFVSTSRQTWSHQLCSALREQVTWLKPTGIVCLLLPHKDAGRSAGEEDMKDTMSSLGWKVFFERDRSIHQSHTRQSWTSIKKETILAFSRVSA